MTVNAAVNRSDAFYVFILNSDTEVKWNILPLLCAAFDADPKLAAITPAGNNYEKFDLNRYMLCEGNYIRTYYLRGHALLIRRDVFSQSTGLILSLVEDIMKILTLGAALILVTGAFVFILKPIFTTRKVSHSEGTGLHYHGHSRSVYLLRYPKAQQNILLLTTHPQ